MYPRSFKLIWPHDLGEALEAVEEGALPLAGGQSLIPMMKLRLVAPDTMVYLGPLHDLNYIKIQNGKIKIGALATHAQIAQVLKSDCPLLSKAASEIGDVQVRNMGTIGGSVAHADPAADYPAALIALGATIKTISKRGTREIAAEKFFTGPYQTALTRGELLFEVIVPKTGRSVGYAKFTRIATDFAIAAVAVNIAVNNGIVENIAIGVSGVFHHPVRARWIEDVIVGKKLNDEVLSRALNREPEFEVISDSRAGKELRFKAFKAMAKKAILEAYENSEN
ncbi:MAG: xanthine dehydrogenase family protein subunit M [Thermofilaceae archaeon]